MSIYALYIVSKLAGISSCKLYTISSTLHVYMPYHIHWLFVYAMLVQVNCEIADQLVYSLI